MMNHPFFISLIGIAFYLIIFIVVCYFIVKAVRKSFQLREEQNQLLRELIDKVEK